jgi:hypothetical protein
MWLAGPISLLDPVIKTGGNGGWLTHAVAGSHFGGIDDRYSLASNVKSLRRRLFSGQEVIDAEGYGPRVEPAVRSRIICS